MANWRARPAPWVLEWIFYAAALALLACMATTLMCDIDGAWLFLLAAALCALVPQFSRLAEISIGTSGLTARLEQALQEAQATLEELQDLAVHYGTTSILLLHGGGRWGGIGTREKLRQEQQILEGLRRVRVPEERVEQVRTAADRYHIIDYVAYVLGPLENSGPAQAARERWSEFQESRERSTPTPDVLEAFLREIGATDAETMERLADYRHFCETSNHRRLDAWLARHDHL